MSYNFDGSNDWIGNITTAPITGFPCTIACWFLAEADVTGNLVNICNSTGEDNLRFVFLGSGRGIRANSVDGGTATFVESTTTTSLNIWYHGCAVFASSTSRTVYLNGGSSSTGTTSSSPTGFTRLHIGSRRASSVTDQLFDGKIIDVGIWNAALTAAEVNSLSKGMNCSLVRPQSLVFYAPLVRDIFDYANAKLALTNNGGATVSDLNPRIYL